MTRLTALLLIALPIGFNAVFLALGRSFAYPDILRRAPADILKRFQAGGRRLVATWYLFVLTALLFTPAALLAPHVLRPGDSLYLAVTGAAGVLAALVQVLGLLRWPFAVPYLARTYTDPQASPAAREAAAVVFQALHRYLGMAVGEHLGYLFTGVWSVLLAWGMLDSSAVPAWLGWAGVLPAAGILAGLLEPAGWKAAEPINAIGYVLWSLWMVAVGFALLV